MSRQNTPRVFSNFNGSTGQAPKGLFPLKRCENYSDFSCPTNGVFGIVLRFLFGFFFVKTKNYLFNCPHQLFLKNSFSKTQFRK